MDGWIAKPANFDSTKKYPVVFYVYTEPWGQTAKDEFGAGYNHLYKGMEPAEGAKLYLKETAPSRPLLASEVKKPAATTTYIRNASLENNYTTHIVQTKETLYAISKKYGVTVEDIMKWNNLQTIDLKIGQQIRIKKTN